MFLRAEPTEKVAEKVLDEFNDVEELKEVVDEILALQENEIYEKLVFLSFDDLLSPDVEIDRDKDKYSLLEELALGSLSKFPLNIPLAPLISIKHFLVIYSFIAGIYHVTLGRKLNLDDRKNIFHGPMATRILLMLENFDSNQKTPQPTAEFFKKLGKVKWQDKKAKKLFDHIYGIRFMLMHNKWKGPGGPSSTFRVTEKAFILLLSGCSAVLEGRNKINAFDVIRANKTYLKLLNTDISKLM
ncbi:MAG: hypothetical protein PQ975_06990 [Methanobacterium sp.]|jgi:hypothetical protein